MSPEAPPPKVSIIIAVYNGAKTLPRTLESLCQQTFKDFEIVIVNDGSQDNSEEVILDFQKKHPRIAVQYITQKNKGLGGARNTAMRQALAPILSLLDQDDIWYPSKLGKVIEAFEKYSEISFVSHHLFVRARGEIKEELCCGFKPSGFMGQEEFNKLLFKGNHFCCAATSFRKDVLKKIGYFSEDKATLSLSEDYDYWLRATAVGLRFLLLKDVLGEYIVHETNFSKNKRLMLRNEWNVVWKHYRKRPFRSWWDPLQLIKRRGKILVSQILTSFDSQKPGQVNDGGRIQD